MTTPQRRRIYRGPPTLFPGKIRKPRSFTMTPEATRLLVDTEDRLGLSRSDVLGLLITRYAADLALPPAPPTTTTTEGEPT